MRHIDLVGRQVVVSSRWALLCRSGACIWFGMSCESMHRPNLSTGFAHFRSRMVVRSPGISLGSLFTRAAGISSRLPSPSRWCLEESFNDIIQESHVSLLVIVRFTH